MPGPVPVQAWRELAERIIECRRCPRLTSYIRQVARVKVRRYRNQRYWGRPVPGFGDTKARLLVVGLAPAAHGANRTGRLFTGDSAGDWLARALYETGFANQPYSRSIDDGLELRDAYLTAAIRCAPPGNRPTRQEVDNCSHYLVEEWRLLGNLKIVLALGHIAFDTCLRYLYPPVKPKPKFRHGASYSFPGQPLLVASYHPSRQNTQTGRLTWTAWIEVFRGIAHQLGLKIHPAREPQP